MLKPTLLAAALIAAIPAQAAAPAAPTKAQLRNAQQTLSLIVSAINQKDVPQDLKNGLFGCLYEAPLGEIAAKSADVLAKNKKLDPRSPDARLLVIAKVCGAPLPVPAASKGKGR